MKFIIVLALAATAASSAKASQVPQYNNGDLLLGFYDYSGGVTNDYVVDLGPISGFNLSSNFTLSLGLSTDLAHVFGSNWDTSGNIYFGLAASYPLTAQVFASNPNAGTPWTEAPAQGTPASQVADIGNAYSLSTQANGETYSAGLQQADSSNNSWQSVASNGLQNFYGGLGDGAISDVVTNSLEFDQVNVGSNGTPGTDLGSFSVSSAGNVSFTTAAVPEPSTFAAVGLGIAVLAVARRRRRSQA